MIHFLDLCHEVGCVSPSEKESLKMLDERKYAVKTVAEEVIRANRREHVAMEKKLYGRDRCRLPILAVCPFMRIGSARSVISAAVICM